MQEITKINFSYKLVKIQVLRLNSLSRNKPRNSSNVFAKNKNKKQTTPPPKKKREKKKITHKQTNEGTDIQTIKN